MSVSIGVDFGAQSTVIAQAVRGGVDVILNESSKRLTPTMVSFVGNERFLGEQATTQVRTNMQNTITNLKRIVGRKLSEPGVQYELATFMGNKAVALADDEIGFEVRYKDEAVVLSATQLLGTYFTKTKQIVQMSNPAVQTPDAVISVPAYFTDAQRHAVRDAATIAGINCVRLLNEGTAIALSYGIFKSAKREFAEGVETKVIFLDMGHAHFTATVAAFTNTGMRILASASDDSNGGRELDVLLSQHFNAEFKAKTGLDAWADKKARTKLMVAAEKAKSTVSPYGVNTAPVSIECLVQERDYSAMLPLEKLDELAAPLVARMAEVILRALMQAGCSATDLAAVELVGGGMRPRVVKRAAAQALGMPLSEETGHGLGTSMNMDEAVARGCAIASAMLSPTLRVKPYDIQDRQQYSIRVLYEPVHGAAGAAAGGGMDLEEEGGAGGSAAGATSTTAGGLSSMTIFQAGDAAPLTRRITFKRSGPFELELQYGDDAQLPAGASRCLGKFTFSGFPAGSGVEGAAITNSSSKARINFSIDISGLLVVNKAELLKEVPSEASSAAGAEGKAMDVEAAASAAAAGAEAAAAPTEAAAAGSAESGAAAGAASGGKKKFKRSDLSVSLLPGSGNGAMARLPLDAATQQEEAMKASDAIIRATQDMRNSLEAYIYSTRSALDETLGPYVTEEERESLGASLSSMEDWLYNEGFEADKSTYEGKLRELQATGNRLLARKSEDESRGPAGEALLTAIEHFRGIISNRSGLHGHLSDSDRDVLRAACSEAENWFRGLQDEQAKLRLNQDPVLRAADIKAKHAGLARELNPIANKPVPPPSAPVAVQAPAPAPAAEADTTAAAAEADTTAAAPEGGIQQGAQAAAPEAGMEVEGSAAAAPAAVEAGSA